MIKDEIAKITHKYISPLRSNINVGAMDEELAELFERENIGLFDRLHIASQNIQTLCEEAIAKDKEIADLKAVLDKKNLLTYAELKQTIDQLKKAREE